MEEFDDFLIGPQSDEFENDWYIYEEETHREESPHKR